MFQLQLLTSAAHIQYNCRLQCNKFLSFNNKHFTNACILRAVVADTTGCARYLWTRLPITTSINTSSFYLFTFVFTSRRIYYCRVAASRLTQNMKPHAALIQVTTAPLYSCGKILGFRGETGAHKWKKKSSVASGHSRSLQQVQTMMNENPEKPIMTTAEQQQLQVADLSSQASL